MLKILLISLYSQNTLKSLLSWCLTKIPAFSSKCNHGLAISGISTILRQQFGCRYLSHILFFLVFLSLNKIWNHSLSQVKLRVIITALFPYMQKTHIKPWEFFLYQKCNFTSFLFTFIDTVINLANCNYLFVERFYVFRKLKNNTYLNLGYFMLINTKTIVLWCFQITTTNQILIAQVMSSKSRIYLKENY